MSEAERAQFEDRFASDDELFYEIALRENELVDGYVRGELSDREVARFEHGLDTNPARRNKVANARVLAELIADERPETKTITIAERSGFFGKLFAFPAFQFASVGLIAILALATILLLLEYRRLNGLESELASARAREAELSSQIEAARESSGDLTEDLIAERDRIEKLEADIAALRNTSANTRPPANVSQPTIATLILSPLAGVRGGSVPMRRLEVKPGVERVSIIAQLENDAAADRVSARLNGEIIGQKIPVRIRTGAARVSVIIPVSRLKGGRNDLVILDDSGAVLDEFAFSLEK
jgi:hypothetical protein